MQASLAFLNGAGARTTSGDRQRAFLRMLHLLCTSYRAAGGRRRLRGRAR